MENGNREAYSKAQTDAWTVRKPEARAALEMLSMAWWKDYPSATKLIREQKYLNSSASEMYIKCATPTCESPNGSKGV